MKNYLHDWTGNTGNECGNTGIDGKNDGKNEDIACAPDELLVGRASDMYASGDPNFKITGQGF